MSVRPIHPVARLGVARIFLANIPNISAEMAVNEATRFIIACHKLGLEVGPMSAFGPESVQDNVLDMAAELIDEEWGTYVEGLKQIQ